jgi:hypothetical protein
MDSTLPIGIVELQSKPAVYHIGHGIVGQIKPGDGRIESLIGYVIFFQEWILEIGQSLIALLNDALGNVVRAHSTIIGTAGTVAICFSKAQSIIGRPDEVKIDTKRYQRGIGHIFREFDFASIAQIQGITTLIRLVFGQSLLILFFIRYRETFLYLRIRGICKKQKNNYPPRIPRFIKAVFKALSRSCDFMMVDF